MALRGVPTKPAPETVELSMLAGQNENMAFFDKKKLVPKLGFELGFRGKIGYYDVTLALAGGDTNVSDMCYDPDRNRIWATLEMASGRVLRINPDTLTCDRLTLAIGNDNPQGICYGYGYIWVVTAQVPTRILRVNPDTLAYDVVILPNDGGHDNAQCVCCGAGYVWVSCLRSAGANDYVVRMNPDDLTYTSINVRAVPNFWYGAVNSIVFDGQRIWVCGNDGYVSWIDIGTLAVTDAVQVVPNTNLFGLYYDGSHVWACGAGGVLHKINPLTYAYNTLILQNASNLYRIAFDGKYLYVTEQTTGYLYIVHPETMEYAIHEDVLATRRPVTFDGTHIWSAQLGNINMRRYLVHEPSRRVEHGQTATFAIDVLANISIAVTFDLPFSRTPFVVVSLNDVTDQAASIVNVEAQTVTVNGFNCRARVAVAGAGGSTARFMWIATERSTHHP